MISTIGISYLDEELDCHVCCEASGRVRLERARAQLCRCLLDAITVDSSTQLVRRSQAARAGNTTRGAAKRRRCLRPDGLRHSLPARDVSRVRLNVRSSAS